MRRSIEGYLIILLLAPILMHAAVQVAVFLLSLALKKSMGFGRPIPSLPELIFIFLFAAPVAIGAYHYVTQSSQKGRRVAVIVMVVPLALLWAIQAVDRLVQSTGAARWLMDHWLLLALALGLLLYAFAISWVSRVIANWQATNG